MFGPRMALEEKAIMSQKSRGFVLCSVAILGHLRLHLSGSAQHCQTWFSFQQSVSLSFTKAQLCLEQNDVHDIRTSACYVCIHLELQLRLKGGILQQNVDLLVAVEESRGLNKVIMINCLGNQKFHGNPSNAANMPKKRVVASEVC